MGRIGIGEIIVILAVVLIIFGPKKLPELGTALGEFFKRFKQASRETEEEIKKNIEDYSHDKKS